ncbi:hypothetical protein L1887_57430 [Cichorium endivia]|nr:hypothetical protein L1887_57430 [Cichorium endivia]
MPPLPPPPFLSARSLNHDPPGCCLWITTTPIAPTSAETDLLRCLKKLPRRVPAGVLAEPPRPTVLCRHRRAPRPARQQCRASHEPGPAVHPVRTRCDHPGRRPVVRAPAEPADHRQRTHRLPPLARCRARTPGPPSMPPNCAGAACSPPARLLGDNHWYPGKGAPPSPWVAAPVAMGPGPGGHC